MTPWAAGDRNHSDSSTQNYTYNSADQVLTSVDELGKTSSVVYDNLGRQYPPPIEFLPPRSSLMMRALELSNKRMLWTCYRYRIQQPRLD